MTPDYTKIYNDLLKYRNQTNISEKIKKKISNLRTVKDILSLEAELFTISSHSDNLVNRQLRCYDEETIKSMLKEQKQDALSNTELARKYKLSRNTVAKWKKVYGNVGYLQDKQKKNDSPQI